MSVPIVPFVTGSSHGRASIVWMRARPKERNRNETCDGRDLSRVNLNFTPDRHMNIQWYTCPYIMKQSAATDASVDEPASKPADSDLLRSSR